VPDERANDSKVHIPQGHWLQIRRLCAEGSRAYLGISAVCPAVGTEAEAIPPERAAEFSKGHISPATDEGPNRDREQ